ncbi:putative GTP1/OBG domain superfamily protein [Helianthus annuus]|nr:putative GTP1/OBG domain superfamily protein [Helianthus annuus]
MSHGKAHGCHGGRGGDVILECSPAIWDLSSLQHHTVYYIFLPFCIFYG